MTPKTKDEQIEKTKPDVEPKGKPAPNPDSTKSKPTIKSERPLKPGQQILKND